MNITVYNKLIKLVWAKISQQKTFTISLLLCAIDNWINNHLWAKWNVKNYYSYIPWQRNRWCSISLRYLLHLSHRFSNAKECSWKVLAPITSLRVKRDEWTNSSRQTKMVFWWNSSVIPIFWSRNKCTEMYTQKKKALQERLQKLTKISHLMSICQGHSGSRQN
jgi:hypothetical protein